ncbi:type II secretion system F family protein [Desulfoglaeba alkanexedens]|uniref:Type II secretion system F family protein n=1 Tax=Desulfoglaeba alkanexedens ALDC TaxID=980445 RepID=A0A4P8L4Z8_9BACT|nr:type II secretion system F family protein [Desulfoglaeba alkanexedens]QCQ22970.1 type II secretion system F family protein [Desulfoglaeba alkanexedens ALDC]
MDVLIGTLVFLSITFCIQGLYGIVLKMRTKERKEKQIKRVISGDSLRGEERKAQIVKRNILSEIPWLNRWLSYFRGIRRLDRLREQAGIRYPAGFFILLSLFLAFLGLYLSAIFLHRIVVGLSAALILGASPYFYLNYKKRKRMERFERQLPEALEFMARSLRAGHAFIGSLRMVAENFSDPLGTEFAKTFEEINYGVALPQALRNLTGRMDVTDLRFFVVAIIIQRETGGNLAHILENISYTIRERFKLAGQIKALTAEGRLSAIILCIMPFGMAFLLFLINPDYIKTFLDDPIGPFFIGLGLFMMILGIISMKRIVRVRV